MYANMKVDALRAAAKAKGLKGYSSLNKNQLISYLESGNRPVVTPKPGTAPALRQECKDKKYVGYSSLNKAGLTHMLSHDGAKPTLEDGTYKVGTVNFYQQFCREHGIKGFSGKAKDALIAHIKAAGYVVGKDGTVKAKAKNAA